MAVTLGVGVKVGVGVGVGGNADSTTVNPQTGFTVTFIEAVLLVRVQGSDMVDCTV